MSYIVKRPEIRTYSLQEIELKLKLTPDVFTPPDNPITAQHLMINPEEIVIDIGTGCGVYAILSAMMGGKVYATDISTKAIELAKENAKLNKTDIEFKTGQYFALFSQKFDVIISNFAQTLLFPNYKKRMGMAAEFVDGGKDGNEKVIRLLKKSKKHMHKDSRLYCNIYTVSDYKKTLDFLADNYKIINLLKTQPEPVKDFIIENLDWYLEQKDKIHIFRKNNIWMANQMLFELKL